MVTHFTCLLDNIECFSIHVCICLQCEEDITYAIVTTGLQFNIHGKNNQAYPCSKCGRVYQNKSTLNRHLKFECGQLPQFACPFCEHKSKRKYDLFSHVRLLHDGNWTC
ncbi:longitudinals lacking protein, isoforms A/B/D/L-like [Frankliniella occidentalis]|uniref:Longitudinals lacking protein, isoforms A/B/D/L-like n=1 Tax=Frankliniella occidentalis TaxID=133901 RepID=A0A6J1TE01_FRAOC|nr:longitudinals lacking protein, isoforms A/B/D/L-like [Frankliniella occidentalis]